MVRQFFVPGQPQGKARARVLKNGHSYTPDKTMTYESLIVSSYMDEYSESSLMDGALKMHINAIFPITKTDGKVKKRKALMLDGEILPTKKPDADNVAKCVCDALNKVAYVDDTHIVRLLVTKAYGERPGLLVSISDTRGEG